MLDAYIIDAIKELERQQELEDRRRLRLELPRIEPRLPRDEVTEESWGPVVIPLNPPSNEDEREEDAA